MHWQLAGASSTSGWFGGRGGCLNSKTGDALGCCWFPWAYGIARHLRAGSSMLHIGDADVHFFFTRAAEARNAPCSEADCKGTLPGGVSGSLMRQTKGHTQRQARCLRLSTAARPLPHDGHPAVRPPMPKFTQPCHSCSKHRHFSCSLLHEGASRIEENVILIDCIHASRIWSSPAPQMA